MAAHARAGWRVKLGHCKRWNGYTKNGYAFVYIGGRGYYLHRLIFVKAYGALKRGECVLHRCDVRNCIRLSHLFSGTRADNNRDMWAKGRGQIPVIRGEIHHKVTVSDADVRIARRARGTQREIAKRFGVAQATIQRWKQHITRASA